MPNEKPEEELEDMPMDRDRDDDDLDDDEDEDLVGVAHGEIDGDAFKGDERLDDDEKIPQDHDPSE